MAKYTDNKARRIASYQHVIAAASATESTAALPAHFRRGRAQLKMHRPQTRATRKTFGQAA